MRSVIVKYDHVIRAIELEPLMRGPWFNKSLVGIHNPVKNILRLNPSTALTNIAYCPVCLIGGALRSLVGRNERKLIELEDALYVQLKTHKHLTPNLIKLSDFFENEDWSDRRTLYDWVAENISVNMKDTIWIPEPLTLIPEKRQNTIRSAKRQKKSWTKGYKS